ncbi:MAG TPA: hypothetical protein VFA26_13115 [Gemmataceae bacterium]|nr:hypothetical protein [Gemmataceae bacterium]
MNPAYFQPLGNPDDGGAREEMMAYYDAPAYVRRARRVEQSLADLLARCQRQREEWVGMVRLRVGLLGALAGDWDRLRPLLADAGQAEALRGLHAELSPRLRVPVRPTSSEAALRRAVGELGESIERFNRRWVAFLARADLAPVNEAREAYNRYYVVEKECALRGSPGARPGFRPLPPFTREELERMLPPLPVPRLR